MKPKPAEKPFLTDVVQLRQRARAHIGNGPVTPNYEGDAQQTVAILQSVLATEIVCWLRYTMNAVAAQGINSEGVKGEFEEHAEDERQHARQVADRINQLGGTPDMNPAGLATKSAAEYVAAEKLVDMIRENLVAERIACEHYRELVRFFGQRDPVTRIMLENILAKEEEHANDMHDLLVAHEGKPGLAE
ncbi:MAG: bacterioferritin [Pseudomonadota bacterium]|nr:bacterioferritin [Pseudomonadota bacterium]